MPGLQKNDTYRNMDSYAITVQNTERDMKVSQSMRSDRNEDTMRPMAGQAEEEHLALENIGKQRT